MGVDKNPTHYRESNMLTLLLLLHRVRYCVRYGKLVNALGMIRVLCLVHETPHFNLAIINLS